MSEQLTEKCKSCLGCNRLLLEDFKGVYRCNNYIKGAKEDEDTSDRPTEM